MASLSNLRSIEEERAAFIALTRSDFLAFFERTFLTVCPGDPFKPNWHIEAIAYQLEQCRLGRLRRLIVSVPPRSGKSVLVSVALTAWWLGHDPTVEIMHASYGRELSAKFHRDTRAVMASAWYRAAFPSTRIGPEKDSEHELVTTRRGSRMATSLDGMVTGRGCDVLIIDDPQKAHDAMSKAERERVINTFDTTLSTRLNDKNTGVIVVVAQRLHVDDLIGHLLATGDWKHICIPAIAQEAEEYRLSDRRTFVRPVTDVLHPERESYDRLMEAKRQLGTMQFAAQYLQSPVPESGNLIRWEWFKTYREAPPKVSGDKIVISIDTASKAEEINDYSVATVWLVKGGFKTGCAYLIDLYRERLLFPDLKRKVESIVERHRPDAVVIEDKGSGTSLIQVFRDHRLVRPIAFKPHDDKVTRMSHQAVKIESGRVFIPEQSPWLGEFRAELLAFPKGKHDDQVDSVAQFLAWLDQHVEYAVGTMRITGMR